MVRVKGLNPQPSGEDTSPPQQNFSLLLGIRTKMFLALSSLAFMTAIASLIAWYTFFKIDQSVSNVTTRSVPSMVIALRLAEKSAELSATSPNLMASLNDQARVEEKSKLEIKSQELVALISELSDTGLTSQITVPLLNIERNISESFRELNEAVELRLQFMKRKQKAVFDLATSHTRLLEVLEPLVDNAFFDLVINGERVTAESGKAITDLVESGVSRLNQLLTIYAEGNLAAGLLAEAAHLRDPVMLQPIREQYSAAAATISRNLNLLPQSVDKEQLRKVLGDRLVSRNYFESRAKEKGVTNLYPDFVTSDAIKKAHEAFIITLIPMIDDHVFNVVMKGEKLTADSANAITDLEDIGVYTLHSVLTIRAEINLAAGLLNQAAIELVSSRLQPLYERFVGSVSQIRKLIKELPSSPNIDVLQDSIVNLTKQGIGENSIFSLRGKELVQQSSAQEALQRSRTLSAELVANIADLVVSMRGESNQAATNTTETISRGKLLILLITATSIVAAALVIFNYVGPRIIKPLEQITIAMSKLAKGDTSVDIPGRDRKDEMGRMAHALGVFRDTAIEVQKSNLKEIKETRRRLSDAIETISEGFSLYDSDDRLVVYNSKYMELLYPDKEVEISPGMTFEAIIRQAVENGYIANSGIEDEQWVEERMARHLNPVGSQVHQRKDGRWIMVSERKTIDGGAVAVYSDITELKQREKELADKSEAMENLSNQLAKYLSPQVYDLIFTGKKEVRIASHRKKLTIFFSDIVDFTETADRLESEDLTSLLNHYLTEMSHIALAHGATIDKYVGDAIIIFFGDPESNGVKEDAVSCARMAIEMREKMKGLETLWLNSGIKNPLKCRMGMNTGYCTVGNFGSEDRMDYTIIGGGVNLASRLESASPTGEILISYDTYALIKDDIHCEQDKTIEVKGIPYPVETYRVIDSTDKLSSSRRLIQEDLPNVKINIDLDALSQEEKNGLKQVFVRALNMMTHSTENQYRNPKED